MCNTLTNEERHKLSGEIEKYIQENGKYTCYYCFRNYEVENEIEGICEHCLKARFVDYGAKAEGCAFCQNLRYESDCDDVGYTLGYWFECAKMPQYQGLNTFPFKNAPKKCVEKGYFKIRREKHFMCD